MNWTVFFRWVLANVLGGVVGYLTGVLAAFVVGPFGMLIGGIIGAVMSFAQWQMLRDYVKGMRSIPWVLSTAVGFGLCIPVLSFLGYAIAYTVGLQVSGDTVGNWLRLSSERGNLGPLEAMLALVASLPSALIGAAVVGALVGSIVGLSQMLVLRRYLRHAPWWIVANALAGAVGVIAALYVAIGIYDGADNLNALFMVALAISPPGVFIFGSFVTGFALAWLVREPHAET